MAEPKLVLVKNVLRPHSDPWAAFAAAVREVFPKLGIEVGGDGHSVDMADTILGIGRLADRVAALERRMGPEHTCQPPPPGTHVHSMTPEPEIGAD